MLLKALFLLLPAVAFARIDILIKATINHDDALVSYNGSNVDIISDLERKTYGIGDEPLKDAVRLYTGVPPPQDAFVRSPTPWGDLYSRYRWPQVQRILSPVNGRVLGIRSQPGVVASQRFINNSSVKVTYNTSLTQTLEQTISITWSKNSELSVSQEIFYLIKFEPDNTTFLYSASWGQETTKSQSVDSSIGVNVELDPGQSVVASLTASRFTIDIEVEYIATLDGLVACNYPKRYQGHHFWGHDINDVLNAAHKEKRKSSTEIIKIGFYTEGKIVLSD